MDPLENALPCRKEDGYSETLRILFLHFREQLKKINNGHTNQQLKTVFQLCFSTVTAKKNSYDIGRYKTL